MSPRPHCCWSLWEGSVPAISGGSTWVVLYAKYFVLVVGYVNVSLVVIYDEKAIVWAQLRDAVATGLRPFSQDGVVFYYSLRKGQKCLRSPPTWEQNMSHGRPFVRTHAAQCIRAEGAYFIFVSKQIKEEFKV